MTYSDHNPDRIKLKAFQKVVSTIMGAQKISKSLKYFEICPSQLRSFESFGDGSIGCPKITKDKSSDANYTSTHRSRFKLKCRPRVQ